MAGGSQPFAQQGSREYFESILESMKSSPSDALALAGEELSRIYESAPEKVEYIEVRSAITNGDVGKIQVSTFDIKAQRGTP